MSNEEMPLNVRPNPLETNQYNEWQGRLRYGVLDIDMINYALQCDAGYSGNLRKNLVMTCLDQVEGSIRATKNGRLSEYSNPVDILPELYLPVHALAESRSACGGNLEVVQKTSFDHRINRGIFQISTGRP